MRGAQLPRPDRLELDVTDRNRPGRTDRNQTDQTDQNRTDRNQTDRNRTGPGPDRTRTGVTSAEQRLPIMDHGSTIKSQGSWIKYQGSRIMDQVSSVKYPVSKIKDLGPCSGMNEHPGRDTDMISRLSKSTIKDLSFYVGFTRIRSSCKDRIKDQGLWTLFWHEWAS